MKGRSMWDLVPKAAGPVSFASPTASPIRSYSKKGGGRVSLFPREFRRRVRTSSFDKREPSSPKVSCIGQVGNRKNNNNNKKESEIVVCNGVIKRLLNFFQVKRGKTRKQSHDDDDDANPKPNPVVVEIEAIKSLGQIKQFASGRGGVLHNFKCEEEDHDL